MTTNLKDQTTSGVKVGNIESLLGDDDSETVYTSLANIAVSDSGHNYQVASDDGTLRQFPLDEVNLKSLAKHLGLNSVYLGKCPGPLKATNLNFWLAAGEYTDVALHIAHGGIQSFYNPDTLVVPVEEVVRIAARVFDADDDVVDFRRSADMFKLDITSPRFEVNVPGNGMLDRPTYGSNVGDITEAGLRFLAYADPKKPPRVSAFMNRLVCTNGMEVSEESDVVNIKGQSVHEVIAEMESAARSAMAMLPVHLENLADSARILVPGSTLAFIRQVGHENNVPERIISKALDLAAGNSERAWSLYDVVQLFTSIANGLITNTSTMKLQRLGGMMVTEGERMVARCSSCERVL